METTLNQSRPRAGAIRRRWVGLVVIASVVLTVLAIVVARQAVGDNLAWFGKVEPGGGTCTSQDGLEGWYCLESVSYPDLLVQTGRTEMHLFLQDHEDGRMISVPDPFTGDPADQELAWGQDGLSITDGSITLTYSLKTLAELTD